MFVENASESSSSGSKELVRIAVISFLRSRTVDGFVKETDHHDEDDQIYGEGEEVQDNTSSGGSNKLVIPEDGYEWKKYGQKFIKNVRKFRSYFKCQNSNCRAKKRAEWSSSEPDELRVVYEGVHNHTDNNASSAGSASHSQQPDSSSSLNPSTDANRYDLYTQVFGNQSFSNWDQKS